MCVAILCLFVARLCQANFWKQLLYVPATKSVKKYIIVGLHLFLLFVVEPVKKGEFPDCNTLP